MWRGFRQLLNKNAVIIDVILTHHCNFACSYCISGIYKEHIPDWDVVITKEQIDIMCKNFSKTFAGKDVTIVLCGGEPTMFKEFKYLLSSLNKLDCIYEIVISTNFSRSFDFWKDCLYGILYPWKLTINTSLHLEFCNIKEHMDKFFYFKSQGYRILCKIITTKSNIDDVENSVNQILYQIPILDSLSIMPVKDLKSEDVFLADENLNNRFKALIKKVRGLEDKDLYPIKPTNYEARFLGLTQIYGYIYGCTSLITIKDTIIDTNGITNATRTNNKYCESGMSWFRLYPNGVLASSSSENCCNKHITLGNVYESKGFYILPKPRICNDVCKDPCSSYQTPIYTITD